MLVLFWKMLKNSLSIDLYARIYAQFMIRTLSLSLLRIEIWIDKVVDVLSILVDDYLYFRAKNIASTLYSFKTFEFNLHFWRENSNSFFNIWILAPKMVQNFFDFMLKIVDFLIQNSIRELNFKQCTLVEFYFANQIPFPLSI